MILFYIRVYWCVFQFGKSKTVSVAWLQLTYVIYLNSILISFASCRCLFSLSFGIRKFQASGQIGLETRNQFADLSSPSLKTRPRQPRPDRAWLTARLPRLLWLLARLRGEVAVAVGSFWPARNLKTHKLKTKVKMFKRRQKKKKNTKKKRKKQSRRLHRSCWPHSKCCKLSWRFLVVSQCCCCLCC